MSHENSFPGGLGSRGHGGASVLLEDQGHERFKLLATRLLIDSVRNLLAIVLSVGLLDVSKINLRTRHRHPNGRVVVSPEALQVWVREVREDFLELKPNKS